MPWLPPAPSCPQSWCSEATRVQVRQAEGCDLCWGLEGAVPVAPGPGSPSWLLRPRGPGPPPPVDSDGLSSTQRLLEPALLVHGHQPRGFWGHGVLAAPSPASTWARMAGGLRRALAGHRGLCSSHGHLGSGGLSRGCPGPLWCPRPWGRCCRCTSPRGPRTPGLHVSATSASSRPRDSRELWLPLGTWPHGHIRGPGAGLPSLPRSSGNVS